MNFKKAEKQWNPAKDVNGWTDFPVFAQEHYLKQGISLCGLMSVVRAMPYKNRVWRVIKGKPYNPCPICLSRI